MRVVEVHPPKPAWKSQFEAEAQTLRQALGSTVVAIHSLAFRDFMTTHPDRAQAYSDLKRELAAQHPTDIDGYMDGKDGFIQEMQQWALA